MTSSRTNTLSINDLEKDDQIDVKREMAGLVKDIAKYSINNIVVKNLKDTEREFSNTLPEVKKQIKLLNSTVESLEIEKNKIINGITREQNLLIKDREALNDAKKSIDIVVMESKASFDSISDENKKLVESFKTVKETNLSIKNSFHTTMKEFKNLEESINYSNKKYEETTRLINEIIENHKIAAERSFNFMLITLITLIVLQFIIIALLVV